MIKKYDPIIQAIFASLFTWGVTALGAALVFVLPSNNKKFLDVSLGFAAGVMTAASFWSLLAPAIEISESSHGKLAFIPVSIGFALGSLFVHLSDKLIPSCVVAELSLINAIQKCEGHQEHSRRPRRTGQKIRHGNTERSSDIGLPEISPSNQRYSSIDAERVLRFRHALKTSRMNDGNEETTLQYDDPLTPEIDDKEGCDGNREQNNSSKASSDREKAEIERIVSWKRILLLIMAVTVHNIPEGLAVGVGFGSVGKTPAATFEKAFNLALGIGLQNFPEGLAVSLPLSGFGYTKIRAFIYGQMSGVVEPFASILGASAVLLMEPVLPYALSFAAGAMIYVVFDDIIPEAQRNGNGKIASLGAILGFLVMMCLDVSLG